MVTRQKKKAKAKAEHPKEDKGSGNIKIEIDVKLKELDIEQNTCDLKFCDTQFNTENIRRLNIWTSGKELLVVQIAEENADVIASPAKVKELKISPKKSEIKFENMNFSSEQCMYLAGIVKAETVVKLIIEQDDSGKFDFAKGDSEANETD